MTSCPNEQPSHDDDRSAGPGRRAVIQGVASVGGVAAAGVALAACGGGSAGSGDAAAAQSQSVPATIAVSKVAVGSGYIDASADVVVTQPTAGQYKAFSAVCTHQGCTVSQIRNGAIICPCHGSEFSIKDGDVLQGPATEPLPVKTVTVSGANLNVS